MTRWTARWRRWSWRSGSLSWVARRSRSKCRQVDLKLGRSWGDAKHTWEKLTGPHLHPSRAVAQAANVSAAMQENPALSQNPNPSWTEPSQIGPEPKSEPAAAFGTGHGSAGGTTTPAGRSPAKKKAPPPLEIELTRLTRTAPLTKQSHWRRTAAGERQLGLHDGTRHGRAREDCRRRCARRAD
jgi:hypothetical protein